VLLYFLKVEKANKKLEKQKVLEEKQKSDFIFKE